MEDEKKAGEGNALGEAEAILHEGRRLLRVVEQSPSPEARAAYKEWFTSALLDAQMRLAAEWLASLPVDQQRQINESCRQLAAAANKRKRRAAKLRRG